MGHGGKRRGAGRKTNAEIARTREIFRSVIPEARWRRIIENLAKLAEKKQSRSALEAFRVLAPYSFGVPTENNSGDESVETLNLIEYVLPVGDKAIEYGEGGEGGAPTELLRR